MVKHFCDVCGKPVNYYDCGEVSFSIDIERFDEPPDKYKSVWDEVCFECRGVLAENLKEVLLELSTREQRKTPR